MNANLLYFHSMYVTYQVGLLSVAIYKGSRQVAIINFASSIQFGYVQLSVVYGKK